MEHTMEQYIKEHLEELEQLLLTLCKIPAPKDGEGKRAKFCKEWLETAGASQVIIDEACNVIYPYHVKPGTNNIIYMAHMDTVFPIETILDPIYQDSRILCPGVTDDTANLAVLLMMAKYVAQYQPALEYGIIFVADSGEEGLGNLKGSRQIMKAYKDKIEYVVSFDLHYDSLINVSVGSIRYQIEVTTTGGHSYSDFGNANAIAVLSSMIAKLYQKKIVETDSKTTYNVGTIQGGTSINCIASQASMTFEMRSDSANQLDEMQKYVDEVIASFINDEVSVKVNTIGIRPCMRGVDAKQQQNLSNRYKKIMEKHTQNKVPFVSASTDCNIPLSEGIPAICFGLCFGGGVHTVNEWIERDSLQIGFSIGMDCLNLLKE